MAAHPQYSANQMLTSLLRDVSRSFYLTLRILPSAIRSQIGLAYLLARTADTIADTELVPVDRRLSALKALRERILKASSEVLEFNQLAQHQGSPAERALLEKCETSVSLLQSLSPFDQELVITVLRTIIGGQELDLLRFSSASSANVISLRSADELDDYTYRVAGCVGEFWTRMCRTHLFPSAKLDESFLLLNGVRFGKGLQLVNILRDLPVDLRSGRCYLPLEQLRAQALNPGDLLLACNEARLRPVYNAQLEKAEAHLVAGWNYTNALPRSNVRVRLACAWPLLIGQETVGLLRHGPVLSVEKRPKVTRANVKAIVWRTVLYYPWPGRWQRLFAAVGANH
jgi:farnesyl-diphosphate farnesyltransferase